MTKVVTLADQKIQKGRVKMQFFCSMLSTTCHKQRSDQKAYHIILDMICFRQIVPGILESI